MDFQIKDTRKSLNIKNIEGEVIKTFTIDVANYDEMKVWQEGLLAFKSPDIDTDIDKALVQFEKIIPSILGEGSWEFLWEVFNHNLIVASAFANDLLTFVNTAMEEARALYV